MQPVDKSVEYCVDEEVSMQERTITELQFGKIFCCVYSNAMTLPTIKAGIPATGMSFMLQAHSKAALPVNNEICRGAKKPNFAPSSSYTST
jgi:hypothetical protein